MSRRRGRGGQRGAVLLIGLVIMALMTVTAAAVVRFSMNGLRIAVSEELRADAFQNAQSLVDATLAVPQNLMITFRLGETNCVAGADDPTCDHESLVLRDNSGMPVSAGSLAESGSSVRLRRIGPETSTPPRNTGYSAVRFQAAYLQVETGYDGTQTGWGRAALNEGVTAIVPTHGQ